MGTDDGPLPAGSAGAKRPRRMVFPRSFYYVLGRLVYGAGQIILIKVLTSTLSATEIGKYYLLLSLVSFMSLVLINPIYMYMTRHFIEWHQVGTGWAMARQFFLYTGGVALASGLLALLLRVTNIFPLEGHLLALVPILVFCTTVSTVPNELSNLIGRVGYFNVMVNIELWGRVGFLTMVYFLLPHEAVAVAGGLAAWGALMSVAACVVLYTLTRSKESAPAADAAEIDLRAMFDYAWPFALSIGLYWCMSDGYRFALQVARNLDAVGHFVVAFSLGGTLMVAIDSLVHQIYLPSFYREIAGANEDGYRIAWEEYANKVVGVFIPCAFFIACGGPFLARWILHAEYWGLGVYAACGAFAQLFRGFAGVLSNGIYAYKKTSSLLLPNFVGALSALVFVFAAGRFDPLLGTGGALILAYFLVSIGLARKFITMSGARLPFREMWRSLTLVAPVCVGLMVANALGLSHSRPTNILVLVLGGVALLATLYRTSRNLFTARD